MTDPEPALIADYVAPRRWFNWRWRPANIWGRYQLRHLPTMTPATPAEEAHGDA